MYEYDYDKLRSCGAELLQIAALGGRDNFLDTPEEKAKAGQFLLGEMNKLERRSDLWDVLKEATDQLLLPNFLKITEPDFYTGSILTTISYFGNITDKLISIARTSGDPIAIDNAGEKREALSMLESTRAYLSNGEEDVLENSIEDLQKYQIARLNPFRYVPLNDKDPITRLFSGRDSLFHTVNEPDSYLYETYRSTCAEGGKYESVCMGREAVINSISKDEITKVTSFLSEARSPEEERSYLAYTIVNYFPNFPWQRDCVEQSASVSHILWLLSSLGYLKYHTFEPGRCHQVQHVGPRHFASGVIENETGTLWMIDTWAGVVRTKEEWNKGSYVEEKPTAF